MVHSLLDALRQRERLVRSVDDDDHLASVQNGAHTHSQRRLRHFVDVVIEEAAVRDHRVVRQRLHARSRAQRGARLVEGDVAIGADASEEQLDAAVLLDLRLVVGTFLEQIGSVSVQNVDILGTRGVNNTQRAST